MSSKVLETLVARGRYANHFREQREIAFGLVDFSTHLEAHEQLVKKGGIDTLLHFLTAIQDAEAQQFAALAVANTASSTSVCREMVMIDGALAGIIQYVGNEMGDSIGRQYCALALGNLLVEPDTHKYVVEAGGIGALLTMLKNCCDAKEFDAARYPTVAVSHIASNSQYHWQIMLGGALELLVALACCEDSDTQRYALAAVRGLCTTAENRVKFCKNGILNPLILMSRSTNIEVVRDVTSALNIMSLEDENKGEISHRAMSTLISLLVSEDDVVERNSCCAIANLVEVKDVHCRFLEELGLAPLIALCSSPYGPCRVEALRAVANLSSNPELICVLIQHNVLRPLVSSIQHDGNDCHFAALAMANIATQPPSLINLVQAGALPHIISLVSGPNNKLAGRRYGALVLANMTTRKDLHSVILSNEGPQSLFALSNSCNDVESRRFVSTALANLSSNTATHGRMIEMGGIRPIVALARDDDSTVHRMAVMALRGLGATSGVNSAIVHEGGLEPLCRLLASNINDVLIEATACLCNLSSIDELKIEIVRSGAVSPLISLILSTDNTVAQVACDCLANLAEFADNQECIVREGAITPCISAMGSQHLKLQQESGRLLSNLAASKNELIADGIVDGGGHDLLVSFLLSRDITCQRMGASGIANLCTHSRHLRTLIGALEPLQLLVRADEMDQDIRRISMLSIAKLGACFKNHDDFMSLRSIPMLVSFSTSTDVELRNYAAHALAEISRNSDMAEIITNEGGLNAVLYLAQSDDKHVQRQVLPALMVLSFLDCNKTTICANGTIPPLLHFIRADIQDSDGARLACCTIANLVEIVSNMPLVVKDGYVSHLVDILDCYSESIKRESARALGNLAVNIEYCDLVIESGAVKRLVACFRSKSIECQRMAAMALSNLSSNLNSHSELLKCDILDHVKSECLVSLDPRCFSDQETERFCILIIANIICGCQDHDFESFFDILLGFTRHRAVRCRLNAIIAMGNLCTNSSHIKRLRELKYTDYLISFAFPPATEESINAQFQAIAGLRCMSKQVEFRAPLLREGILEPLIVSAQGNNRFSCVDIQHQAAATLSNLALNQDNRILIAKSGALPALVNLLQKSDSKCQEYAGASLANLAESSGEVHKLLMSEKCIEPMCRLIQEKSTPVRVKRELSRCIALLTSNSDMHNDLLQPSVINSIKILLTSNDASCERHGALAVANLALNTSHARFLIEANLVESLIQLINSDDAQTLRGTSFAIQSFSRNDEYHSILEGSRAIHALTSLARCADRDAILQSTIAVKHLSLCERCRNMYAESLGLASLLALTLSEDLETKREVVAALRHVSISDKNKESLMSEKGIVDTLAMLARDVDDVVSRHACGLIANLAERPESQHFMVEQGILQHLQFSMLSKSILVTRESIRVIANLSCAKENSSCIVSSGALGHVIHALGSPDLSCQRFASMAMSNLASNYKNNARIVREHGVPPLIAIIGQTKKELHDPQSQHNAMACLANLASCHELHGDLIECGCAEISMGCIKSSDLDLRIRALLCVSNFASNRESHVILASNATLVDELIMNLECKDRLARLRATTSLRGLSIDANHREWIISRGGPDRLLSFVHVDDGELKSEVLSTLCNLSMTGYMGDRSNSFVQQIDMPSLLSFLCDADSTYRLFGAVTIGNIASNLLLQAPVLKSGALQPLIGISNPNVADLESQRCIAYAICNLSVEVSNRMSIIRKGGLPSILYLTQTGDTSDMLVALSTIRGLASSVEARRLLVEEGVLNVLSHAMKSHYLKCKREIGATLVLLSLNEKNKFDLLRFGEVDSFLTLTDMKDVHCARYMYRTLGNISEVHELHFDMLQVLNVEQLIQLCVHTDPIVACEISRLVANFAGNSDTHNCIMTTDVLTNLHTLCRSADTEVCRYSLLAVANLSLNVSSRHALESDDWISMLCSIIDHDYRKGHERASTTFKKQVHIKCSACLAISTLCENLSFARRLADAGIIPALFQLIELDDGDMTLHVAFVLNKLSGFSFIHKDIQDNKFASILAANKNDRTAGHASTYLIAALRRLCVCKYPSVELVSLVAVNFMSTSFDLRSIGLCREIASCVCHLTLLNEGRKHVIESDMFRQVVRLAQSSDIEVSRFSLGALANIANDCRYHEVVAHHTEVLNNLLHSSTSASLSTVRESSRALATLLSSSFAHFPFLNGDGIRILVDLSNQGDYECAYNATVALRKLAANKHAHEKLLSLNGVTTIIVLAHRGERNIQLLSAAALKDISSNQLLKVSLAGIGLIRTAMELASQPDISIMATAFGIIRHLSVPMLLKRNVSESGIVSMMVECVSTTDNEELYFECSSSFANMAEHAQNRFNLVRLGAVPCLVTLCNHSSFRVQREAARAFSFLSSSPEIVGEFDEHILPQILILLRSKEEATSRDGASTVFNVSTSPEIIKLIGVLGGIEPLVLLLTSSFASCQSNAGRTLCRLTVLRENIVLFLSAGGMKPLLKLCTTSDKDVSLISTMVLCNLSTSPECCHTFIREGGLPIVEGLLSSDRMRMRQNAIMIFCNLTSHDLGQVHVARHANLLYLIDMMNDSDAENCGAFAAMTMGNLASNQNYGSAIMEAERLTPFEKNIRSARDTILLHSTLSLLFNLSVCEESHLILVRENIVQSIVNLVTASIDILCRRLALMILTNVSCNHRTRAHAGRMGGVRAALLALKDSDQSLQLLACICLANLSNDTTIQSQIVVHGGLMPLMNHCLANNIALRDCAYMCLSNLAENKSNHSPMIKQGTVKAFVDASTMQNEHGKSLYITFGIANLVNSGEMLSKIGRCGAMKLLNLLKSNNLNAQGLALASLRRLATNRENRERLLEDGFINSICAVKSASPEIQREVALCFCNVSLSSNHRICIARSAISKLAALVKSDDIETSMFSLNAIGNIAEDTTTHSYLKGFSFLDVIIGSLDHGDTGIKREAARAISNLLSSTEIHAHIIRRGIHKLIHLSAHSCQEIRSLIALIFRKISTTIESHGALIKDGLLNIIALANDGDHETRIHALAALRDLSASDVDTVTFFNLGLPATMVKLANEADEVVRLFAVTILRNLSSSEMITDAFTSCGIMNVLLQCISRENEDLRCQVAGLFANLSEFVICQSTMISNGIIYAIDTILPKEEHDDIWQDCSRMLANLSTNEGTQAKIFRQGGLQTLAKLNKSRNEVCLRYVVIATRLLLSSIDIQCSLLKGSYHHAYIPFRDLSANKAIDLQRAAAASFASMSLNKSGMLLVLAKGFVSPILELCIHEDLCVQRDAVFCVANFACSQDFCQYFVKEGGIESIKAVAETTSSADVLRDAARAMSSFSVDIATKEIMISQEIPMVLWKLAKCSDSATQRFVALAICNLCMGTREQKELIVKQGALRVLIFLLRFPDLDVERCASLSISAIALGSDMNKAEVIDFGFVRPLIETITYPDMRICHCALLALNGIALGELAEAKEILLKDNGLTCLFERINTAENESIHYGIYLLGALAENTKIRDTLMKMDYLRMVVDKASLGPIEIKQAAAYFLCIVSEHPELHDEIMRVGGLESAVAFASLVDKECQDYGSLTLAFLADNKSFRVPLVKMGAVRPLVAMIEANSDAKHYAALALVKLADNFENHITIAEEGGIKALLNLGKNNSSKNIQYKASLTVGHMAKSAYGQLDNSGEASIE